MMIHFEMSFPNEYPFKPMKRREMCSSHDEAYRRSGKMKGTALSGVFYGNFETPAFDKLRNGGILQGTVCLWFAFGPFVL